MHYLCLLLFCLPLFSLAQDQNGCPNDSDTEYRCGNVQERILPRLDSLSYTWTTQITVQLKHRFKRKKNIQRAEQAAQLVEQVLNDPDFWKAVEHYDRYAFSKWSPQLNDPWQPIAQQEITNALLNGNPSDSSRPAQQTEVFYIQLYGGSNKFFWETAIGRVNGQRIDNKRWFFKKASIRDIASNWVHEWSHIKGLRHCFKCHRERDYSVSYVINRIFLEVAEKYD